LRREQRKNPKDMLGLIKTDMKNLADIAPLIDDDIVKQFKTKYCDKDGHFATHTANITNGLTPIVINNTKKEQPNNNTVSHNVRDLTLFPETNREDETNNAVVVDVPV
jgi:hypothetical protein